MLRLFPPTAPPQFSFSSLTHGSCKVPQSRGLTIHTSIGGFKSSPGSCMRCPAVVPAGREGSRRQALSLDLFQVTYSLFFFFFWMEVADRQLTPLYIGSDATPREPENFFDSFSNCQGSLIRLPLMTDHHITSNFQFSPGLYNQCSRQEPFYRSHE